MGREYPDKATPPLVFLSRISHHHHFLTRQSRQRGGGGRTSSAVRGGGGGGGRGGASSAVHQPLVTGLGRFGRLSCVWVAERDAHKGQEVGYEVGLQ